MQLSVKNVTIYSMLTNNVLDSRLLSRFNSLNTWLVQIYEVFINDNFNSTVGTYLTS